MRLAGNVVSIALELGPGVPASTERFLNKAMTALTGYSTASLSDASTILLIEYEESETN